MTVPRLIAIGLVYILTTVAWFTLGGTLVARSGESDGRLSQEVAQLWGGRHEQLSPAVWWERPRPVTEDVTEKNATGADVTRKVTRTEFERVPVAIARSRVETRLDLDQRRKGLLWYDTYAVDFRATYVVSNPDVVPREVFVQFSFPSSTGLYDNFKFQLAGREVPAGNDLSAGVVASARLAPGETVQAEVAYRSRGLGDWSYVLAREGVAQVRDFQLTMRTDFAAIDFPPGSLSPTSKTPAAGGWTLDWKFESLVTGQRIGMDTPNRLNPGPLAAEITFFAPVSLLFFMTVMVVIGVLSGRSLHPMNYFFLAAAFFAFHLLLAYLVDHLDIHASFAVAAVVSVFLVTTYLRVVAGLRTALVEAGLAQAIYLVLFSYAFFFKGYTGLSVTVGAIVTLFVLMQLTARVDWAAALRSR